MKKKIHDKMPGPGLLSFALAALCTGASGLLWADAGQITGSWHCRQDLQPAPQVSVQVDYTQYFGPDRNFNLEGELHAEFAENQLAYRFNGDGSWSVRDGQLHTQTRNSQFEPANARAQQLHDMGMLKADQFNNVQSSDRFEIIKLNGQEMHLQHTKENFKAQCTRR